MLWLGIKMSRGVLTILLTRPHCQANIRGSCSQHWHFITHNKTYLQLVIRDHENIGGLMRTIWIRVTINIITTDMLNISENSDLVSDSTAWFLFELIGADRVSSCWPSQGPKENCSSWVQLVLTSSFNLDYSAFSATRGSWWSGIILAIIIIFCNKFAIQKCRWG